VYRVPLEIWEKILVYSISESFLPSLDDSILREIGLLEHDCKSHQEAEQIWADLRLVCRLWNDILKRFSAHSLYWGGPATSPIPRSALRVEILRYSSFCPFFPETMQPKKNEKTVMSQGPYELVEALIIFYDAGDPPDLANFPNLRLITTERFNYRHISSTNPALIRNLTHLRIPALYSKRPPSNGLTFTSLRTFCIDFDIRSIQRYDDSDDDGDGDGDGDDDADNYHDDKGFEPTPDHLDFLNWSLPSLVNLGFIGETRQESVDRAIYELIERFGSTLKGVCMAVYRQAPFFRCYKPLPKNIWTRCVRIETIYTPLVALNTENKPPDGYHPLNVVLFDLHAPSDWDEANDDPEDEYGKRYSGITKIIRTTLDCSVGDLQMDLSWDVLKTRIDGRFYGDLVVLRNLFGQLDKRGRGLKDKNGEGMESEEAEEFFACIDAAKGGFVDISR
jgi:hypothetical protein